MKVFNFARLFSFNFHIGSSKNFPLDYPSDVYKIHEA